MYLSTRRGSWILNRVAEKGTPVDMTVSRFMLNGLWYFPYLAGIYEKSRLNFRFDHRKYCLEPPHDPFAAHPTVNDDLPNRLVAGTVKVKANIRELSESSIKFEDGTTEDEIDALILATGYIFGFPFLDKNVIDVQENKVQLYKYVFPPQLSKPTLAVIGCIQPLGAIMPISEQQCRLAVRVFQVQ